MAFPFPGLGPVELLRAAQCGARCVHHGRAISRFAEVRSFYGDIFRAAR
jgi:hypothetical protein